MRDARLWQELNAYADGELQEEARRRLEAAMADDPALKESLDQITAVKRVLAVDRPSAKKPESNWLVPGAAVAACVVAALIAVLAYLPLQPTLSWQEELLAAHQSLANETFVVEANRPLPVVSSRRLDDFAVPNLRASRLYLVAARTRQDEASEVIVMHYRGLRGCRLTIAAIVPAVESADGSRWSPGEDQLFTGWRIGELGFAVIAEGMDAGRFHAIADYAKAAIEESLTPDDPLRTAMTQAYRAAKPCA
jgi:anti-sigma factor RsiW